MSNEHKNVNVTIISVEYTYIIYITVKSNSCTRSINCCDDKSTRNMMKNSEAQVL